jgi:hypothetical protein
MNDSRTQGTDLIGSVLGGYRIVAKLNAGGMGAIYRAEHELLGRPAAVKLLRPELTANPELVQRFFHEAKAATAIRHPGIVEVYDFGYTADFRAFIVMELLEGDTLGERIASVGRLTELAAAEITRGIASALKAAHGKGIVHRDLKPDNVMRTRDGRLKILDFGLARANPGGAAAAPSVTEPGAIIGTPAYMAPEQLNGETVGARADVFSYGVLLYEYACGVHPFAASTPLATMARVLESDARPVEARSPLVPGGVADVIARCLRKSQAERFASAADVAAALSVAGAADGGAARHATWWRVHQLVIVMLYIAAATLGWQIKEWRETPITVSLFLALGAAATMGGVLRGHLVFTERFNRSSLRVERRRTAGATRILDLLTSALLFGDGVLIVGVGALPAVFAMSLALGMALASVVLEPATTAAAFGVDDL